MHGVVVEVLSVNFRVLASRAERHGLDVEEGGVCVQVATVLLGIFAGGEDEAGEFAAVGAACVDDVGPVLLAQDHCDDCLDDVHWFIKLLMIVLVRFTHLGLSNGLVMKSSPLLMPWMTLACVQLKCRAIAVSDRPMILRAIHQIIQRASENSRHRVCSITSSAVIPVASQTALVTPSIVSGMERDSVSMARSMASPISLAD